MGLFDFFTSKGNRAATVSDAELLTKLKPIIVDMIGVDDSEVVLQANLYDDLGCDELDYHELLLEICKKLGYMVPKSEDKNITTVGNLIGIIKKYNKL